MPLIKQKLSIPFLRGLDTKGDDKQESAGTFHLLQNVLFDTPKKLIKRPGFDSVELRLLDLTKITNPQFLTNFKDELNLFTSTNFYSYSEGIDRWTDKGNVFTAFPTSEPVLRNNLEQDSIDCVVAENLQYLWAA